MRSIDCHHTSTRQLLGDQPWPKISTICRLVSSAIFVFVLGVVAAAFGWGVQLAAALSSLYIGYGPTFVGAIAGAVWAFVDGLIAGVLIAWFYNRFLLRRRKTLV